MDERWQVMGPRQAPSATGLALRESENGAGVGSPLDTQTVDVSSNVQLAGWGMHPGSTPVSTDANGAGTGTISHNLQNLFWRISQVSVDAGGVVITVEIQVNGVACTSVCTGATPLTASNLPTIDIAGHDVMTVVVSAGPPSSSVVVTYWYEEIQGTP